jgi:hypothetical protein
MASAVAETLQAIKAKIKRVDHTSWDIIAERMFHVCHTRKDRVKAIVNCAMMQGEICDNSDTRILLMMQGFMRAASIEGHDTLRDVARFIDKVRQYKSPFVYSLIGS